MEEIEQAYGMAYQMRRWDGKVDKNMRG